ncbi:MAG: DHH family phosphoesterase [Opitutaceae bacterium]|jgi:phosphoesterase RecJ-like protein|nr:DHH family phosphoesterase [Opitutaceae bacterium]
MHFPRHSPLLAKLLADLDRRPSSPLPSPPPLVIIGHTRPDGDCIGSQTALALLLRARGHNVICANPDPVPRRLLFAAATDTLAWLRYDDLDADAARIGGERTALFADCAGPDRAGPRFQTRYAPTALANIDHHLANPGYARHNIVDDTAAAACEILAGLFLDNDLPIDAPIAQALYTGISTDTGQFRFPATTARTFTLAAELVRRGADPAAAGYQLYERETFASLQLKRHFLDSLQLECGGRACIGFLPDGIFQQLGASPEDTEGLVDNARCIEGVDIGVLIEERADSIKASLRAKDACYRVDRIAAQFGGGGHACAAGLNLKGDARPALAEFRKALVAAIAAQFAAVDKE